MPQNLAERIRLALERMPAQQRQQILGEAQRFLELGAKGIAAFKAKPREPVSPVLTGGLLTGQPLATELPEEVKGGYEKVKNVYKDISRATKRSISETVESVNLIVKTLPEQINRMGTLLVGTEEEKKRLGIPAKPLPPPTLKEQLKMHPGLQIAKQLGGTVKGLTTHPIEYLRERGVAEPALDIAILWAAFRGLRGVKAAVEVSKPYAAYQRGAEKVWGGVEKVARKVIPGRPEILRRLSREMATGKGQVAAKSTEIYGNLTKNLSEAQQKSLKLILEDEEMTALLLKPPSTMGTPLAKGKPSLWTPELGEKVKEVRAILNDGQVALEQRGLFETFRRATAPKDIVRIPYHMKLHKKQVNILAKERNALVDKLEGLEFERPRFRGAKKFYKGYEENIKNKIKLQQTQIKTYQGRAEELNRLIDKRQGWIRASKNPEVRATHRAYIRSVNERLDKLNNLIGKRKTRIEKLREEVGYAPPTAQRTQDIATINETIGGIDRRLAQHWHRGGWWKGERQTSAYFPRMYTSKEVGRRSGFFKIFAPRRMRLKYLKGREHIPLEAQREMGLIETAGYPAAKRYVQVQNDIINYDYFKTIKDAGLASAVPTAELSMQLGKTESFGPLKGQFVGKHTAAEINYLVELPKEAEKIANRLMTLWKYNKVILNPATQARNIRSNLILADITGELSPFWDTKIYKEAVRSYFDKGVLYKLAKEAGLFRATTFREAELINAGQTMLQATEQKTITDKIFSYMTFKGDLPGRTYQAVEEMSKHAVFIKQMYKRGYKAGMSLQQARKLTGGLAGKESAHTAIKSLFDYMDVPVWMKKLRTKWYGIPFATFTYKWVPRAIEAGIKHPLRLAKWVLLPTMVEEIARQRYGLSKEELKTKRALLPDEMQSGFWAWVGVDEYGDDQYYDFTFDLPWGDIGEVGKTGLPRPITPFIGSPMGAIPFALLLNKNTFTGEDIYKKTDTLGERVTKVSTYVYQQLAPSWAPPPELGVLGMKGGYSYETMKRAITGEKTVTGKEPSVPKAAAKTVAGMKVRGIDPALQQRLRQPEKRKDINELRNKARKIQQQYQLGNISKKETERRLKRIMDQVNKILSEQ